MKIVTLIVPFHMYKNDRVYLEGVVSSILSMGNAIRSNGNGSVHGPLNRLDKAIVNFVPVGMKVFEGLNNIAPAPTDEQRLQAYQIAMQSYPNMKTWPQEEQDLLLASVYSIYGYSGRKSDLILIYSGRIGSCKNINKQLFTCAKKLAQDSDVPIKHLRRGKTHVK